MSDGEAETAAFASPGLEEVDEADNEALVSGGERVASELPEAPRPAHSPRPISPTSAGGFALGGGGGGVLGQYEALEDGPDGDGGSGVFDVTGGEEGAPPPGSPAAIDEEDAAGLTQPLTLSSGKSPKRRGRERFWSLCTICVVFGVLSALLVLAAVAVTLIVTLHKSTPTEYVSDRVPGYALSNYTTTPTGWTAVLTVIGSPRLHDQFISPLRIDVTYATDSAVRIRIFDPARTRWEVPGVVSHPAGQPADAPRTYSVEHATNPFGVRILRQGFGGGECIFDTMPGWPLAFNGLVFEDHYLELSTHLPRSANLYGLGERVEHLRLPKKTYTLWNGDYGTPEDSNLYGSHPFYLEVRESGMTHGVFLLNSNAMDVELGEDFLTYRTIGGVLDFYVMTGPSPSEVSAQYAALVGRPYMPPFWALGFHQCRWGYRNVSMLRDVEAGYAAADLPLEAMWSDIDYMDEYRDWTLDPVRFPDADIADFVDNTLHANGRRYVIIVDPGIKIEPGYAPYDEGVAGSLFIRDDEGRLLKGRVWPGDTNFPDWTHANASEWWSNHIAAFHSRVAFDGLWIDMNELANFCDGECPDGFSGDGNDVELEHAYLAARRGEAGVAGRRMNSDKRSEGLRSAIDLDHPPFRPGKRNLYDHTIFPSARHAAGHEYDLHNLYGHMEQRVTRDALETLTGKRAFTLTRSTYAGSGSLGNHWLGDNLATWGDLRASISGVLAMNLFGIPLVGSDICGFGWDTTYELCMRWVQLGSFYPFCRNHNGWDSIPQEFYAFDARFTNVTRRFMSTRYALFPYWYTLFDVASTTGVPVARPMWLEFAADEETWPLDEQFLVGPALLVAPALEKDVDEVRLYLPAGRWFDLWTGAAVQIAEWAGGWITRSTPLEESNAMLRGGYVVPWQAPDRTLTATRAGPLTLMAAPDTLGCAVGSLFVDDGESLDTRAAGLYVEIAFTLAAQAGGSNSSLSAQVLHDGYGVGVQIECVRVLGVVAVPADVWVDGAVQAGWSWDAVTGVLSVPGLALPLASAWRIDWLLS